MSFKQTVDLIPNITIILVLNNSNIEFIFESIESVKSQTYQNWELYICCVENNYQNSENRLLSYQYNDKRIILKSFEDGYTFPSMCNLAIQEAKGDYIGFLYPNDELVPLTLLEIANLIKKYPSCDLIYTDEEVLSFNSLNYRPIYKPSFSPDLLMAKNYIGQFCIFRKSLVSDVGGFRNDIKSNFEYDLILRITEVSHRIYNIHKVLYRCRGYQYSNLDSMLEDSSNIKVLCDALNRRGIEGSVSNVDLGKYRIKFNVNKPKISIIIPTRDKVHLLKKCIDSIYLKSSYKNFEVIVINNNSQEEPTYQFFKELKTNYKNVKIINLNISFNYSRLNNLAVKETTGDYLLFLNNDTEVISEMWLEELLGYAQLKHIGAVGAFLLFPDNTIQHGGVRIGTEIIANHMLYQLPLDYHQSNIAFLPRNCNAVTGACMMMKKSIFNEVKGFDEKLDVIFNDVDICLKIAEKGYYNVWTPYAKLYHHEQATRNKEHPKHNEIYYREKWKKKLQDNTPTDVYDFETFLYLDQLKQELLRIKDSREVYIWGAGKGGIRTYEMIKNFNLGINIKGFIDSDPSKWNSTLLQIPVLSYSICLEINNRPYVVIGSMYSKEISTKLESFGFECGNDFSINLCL